MESQEMPEDTHGLIANSGYMCYNGFHNIYFKSRSAFSADVC